MRIKEREREEKESGKEKDEERDEEKNRRTRSVVDEGCRVLTPVLRVQHQGMVRGREKKCERERRRSQKRDTKIVNCDPLKKRSPMSGDNS